MFNRRGPTGDSGTIRPTQTYTSPSPFPAKRPYRRICSIPAPPHCANRKSRKCDNCCKPLFCHELRVATGRKRRRKTGESGRQSRHMGPSGAGPVSSAAVRGGIRSGDRIHGFRPLRRTSPVATIRGPVGADSIRTRREETPGTPRAHKRLLVPSLSATRRWLLPRAACRPRKPVARCRTSRRCVRAGCRGRGCWRHGG